MLFYTWAAIISFITKFHSSQSLLRVHKDFTSPEFCCYRHTPKALPAFPTCDYNGRHGLPYYCTTQWSNLKIFMTTCMRTKTELNWLVVKGESRKGGNLIVLQCQLHSSTIYLCSHMGATEGTPRWEWINYEKRNCIKKFIKYIGFNKYNFSCDSKLFDHNFQRLSQSMHVKLCYF